MTTFSQDVFSTRTKEGAEQYVSRLVNVHLLVIKTYFRLYMVVLKKQDDSLQGSKFYLIFCWREVKNQSEQR